MLGRPGAAVVACAIRAQVCYTVGVAGEGAFVHVLVCTVLLAHSYIDVVAQ